MIPTDFRNPGEVGAGKRTTIKTQIELKHVVKPRFGGQCRPGMQLCSEFRQRVGRSANMPL